MPFPTALSHLDVPVMELILSCDKPSQELFAAPRSRHALCTAHYGTPEDPWSCGKRNVGGVFEEVEEVQNRS